MLNLPNTPWSGRTSPRQRQGFRIPAPDSHRCSSRWCVAPEGGGAQERHPHGGRTPILPDAVGPPKAWRLLFHGWGFGCMGWRDQGLSSSISQQLPLDSSAHHVSDKSCNHALPRATPLVLAHFRSAGWPVLEFSGIQAPSVA